jgi:uncharacterized membrane protein YedE/YeeE
MQREAPHVLDLALKVLIAVAAMALWLGASLVTQNSPAYVLGYAIGAVLGAALLTVPVWILVLAWRLWQRRARRQPARPPEHRPR